MNPQPKFKHYILFIILGTSMVSSLFALVPRVWIPALQNGGLIFDSVAVVIGPIGTLSSISVYLLFAGIFAGAAFLWTLDTYKLVQSIILWVWIIAAVVLFSWHWEGPVGRNIFLGLLFFVIGATVAVQVAGIPLVQRYTRFGEHDKKHLVERPPRRYTGAVLFTFIFVVLGATAALFDSLFRADLGAQLQIQYTIATLGVIVPLYLFQRYANDEKIIQLGPARSGKTSVQGGLYKSVSQPIKKESPLLDEIVEEHMNRGEFPDRTQINAIAGRQHKIEIPLQDGEGIEETNNNGKNINQNTYLVKFSYVTRRDLLFPKKRTITAIDYPGELLTGVENADPLSEYIAQQKESKSWDDVIEGWENETDDLDPDKFMQGMSHLVQYADWILFTVPMDDFLENQVHDRPEMIPEYHRRYLHRIEREEPNADKYVKYDLDAAISTSESKGNIQAIGDTRDHSKKGTSVTEKSPHWRGQNRYYERDKNERAHPNDYLTEYSQVINSIKDTKNHNFMWIATMSDLIYRDFEGYYTKASKSDITWNNTTAKIDISETSISINPDSDLDPEMVQSLFKKTAVSEEYSMLLAKWILEECISEYGPDMKQAMWETFEQHVFPVWFEIGDTENEFDPTNDPVLNGSRHILSRLNGRRLKPRYSSWAGILSYRFLNGRKVISETTMGYEVLEALKESDIDIEPGE